MMPAFDIAFSQAEPPPYLMPAARCLRRRRRIFVTQMPRHVAFIRREASALLLPSYAAQRLTPAIVFSLSDRPGFQRAADFAASRRFRHLFAALMPLRYAVILRFAAISPFYRAELRRRRRYHGWRRAAIVAATASAVCRSAAARLPHAPRGTTFYAVPP